MSTMKKTWCFLFLIFSGAAWAAETPISSSATAPSASAERRPWQIGFHGGVFTKEADENIQDDWDYKPTSSPVVALRFNRTIGRPWLYFIGGFEARYGKTVSELGSSKLEVTISRFDGQVGIGSEAFVFEGFGGYAYLAIKIFGSEETTFHGNNFEHTVHKDNSYLGGGLTAFYKISEAVRVSLTFEPGHGNPILTGVTYAF